MRDGAVIRRRLAALGARRVSRVEGAKLLCAQAQACIVLVMRADIGATRAMSVWFAGAHRSRTLVEMVCAGC